MKKLDKTVHIPFMMPSLFREDLEEIESAIIAVPGHAGLKIQTGNFEYDSFKEIVAGDQITNEIVISSNNPSIRLSLNKRSADIYGSGNDEILVTEITNLLTDIVKKRERKIRWLNARVLIFL